MPESQQHEFGELLLDVASPGTLFKISHRRRPYRFLAVEGPSFEVDGQERGGWTSDGVIGERTLAHGGRENTFRYVAPGRPELQLLVDVRWFDSSPVLRFRYRLSSSVPASLTKRAGDDRIRYLTLRGTLLATADLHEIQLSHFDPVAHSYMPNVEARRVDELHDDLVFVGPIAIMHAAAESALLAYEHGADHPRSFFDFRIAQHGAERSLSLFARQANYYDGQPLGPDTAWESVWLELALAPVSHSVLLERYRLFFLDEISENRRSRSPYLFYNTWNYQERNRYFHDRPYLESMTFERIAAEIDVAHELGIEVFVIDTGWYGKTGDWEVDLGRFPDGLREIKRKLDGYGMQLGLWFNPTVAAVSSRVFEAHPEYEMTRNGEPSWRGPVWETEESTRMCLASDYAGSFVETMVRLHDELGVSYFKWDAVEQSGCDSALHHHGTERNPIQERADCYAYQMGRQMVRIVEEVAGRCPDVIVDFDITEGGRFVGLGFLSAGKYFLINNGPYFRDFDIPASTRIDPDTINVFFHPGPARPRICRQGIKFDFVIPSILFLTHYLPDPPALAQRNSLAALMLGGNGVWGDLLALSAEDRGLLAEHLHRYKRVAESVTRAYPRVRGFAGSSPEVYEKLDPAAASGAIIFFTVAAGHVAHVTRPMAGHPLEVIGADDWELLPDGRLKVDVTLERNDARIVYVIGR